MSKLSCVAVFAMLGVLSGCCSSKQGQREFKPPVVKKCVGDKCTVKK
jgi:hypothetical protein